MFEQQFDQNDESQGTDDGVSADCIYPVSFHFLGRQWLADGRHLEEHQTEVSQSQKQQRCKEVVRRSDCVLTLCYKAVRSCREKRHADRAEGRKNACDLILYV